MENELKEGMLRERRSKGDHVRGPRGGGRVCIKAVGVRRERKNHLRKYWPAKMAAY